jgi:hypothetical protein
MLLAVLAVPACYKAHDMCLQRSPNERCRVIKTRNEGDPGPTVLSSGLAGTTQACCTRVQPRHECEAAVLANIPASGHGKQRL